MSCYFIEDVNLFCVLDESLGNYKSRQPTKLYWESIFHFPWLSIRSKRGYFFYQKRIGCWERHFPAICHVFELWTIYIYIYIYIYIFWAQSWNKTWVCTHWDASILRTSSFLFFLNGGNLWLKPIHLY